MKSQKYNTLVNRCKVDELVREVELWRELGRRLYETGGPKRKRQPSERVRGDDQRGKKVLESFDHEESNSGT